MEFWKMHGAGNDFILTDNRTGQIGMDVDEQAQIAKNICHRHFGVGADGFMCVENASDAEIKMTYYNADGSAATMCGNGLRCFAKFVYDQGIVAQKSFDVETGDGVKRVYIKAEVGSCSRIGIDMGKWNGEITKADIMVIDRLFTLAILHIGVPHAVIFLDKKDALNAKIDPAFVVKYGPVIEKDIKFPNGTNVNFAVILDQNHLLASTWERGAGSTLACGTGACASAVAANRLEGMDQGIEVRMPGGDLFISISDDRRISLEGPAQTICKGTY